MPAADGDPAAALKAAAAHSGVQMTAPARYPALLSWRRRGGAKYVPIPGATRSDHDRRWWITATLPAHAGLT